MTSTDIRNERIRLTHLVIAAKRRGDTGMARQLSKSLRNLVVAS